MSLTRDIERSRHLGVGGGAHTGHRPDPVPRQLLRDGNAAFWNPDDIDLARDEADFATRPPGERHLTCLFVANLDRRRVRILRGELLQKPSTGSRDAGPA